MSARRIGANGSSGSDSEPAWPTPMAVHNRTSSTAQTGRPTSGPSRGGASFGLEDVALRKEWPTPTTQGQVSPIDGNTMLGEAWPTTTTTDAKSSARHGYMITGQQGTTLLDAVRLWPTPDAAVGNDGESPATWRARQAAWKVEYDSRAVGEVKSSNGAGLPLTIAAKEWATPTAKISEDSQTHRSGARSGELLLTGQAKEWATPRASEGQHGGPAGRDTSGSLHLSAQGVAWSTPTTQDSENDGPPSAFSRRTMPLNAQATGPRVPMMPTDGEPTSSDTRVLNPRFVEALMGFPTGWTDCALSETPSSRRRRAQLSEFLRSATAPMPSPATRWPLKWV